MPIEEQDIDAQIDPSLALGPNNIGSLSEDFVRGLARMRGAVINEDMAEAFEVSHLGWEN